jgi:hypothetical protein
VGGIIQESRAALSRYTRAASSESAPVFAPERLKQTGGGPEPRIERLVNAVFLEDVGRDKRQMVNGLSEFRRHASCSNRHEANSDDGG